MDRVESALGPVRPFLSSAIKFLKDHNIPIEDWEIDHVCYRCPTVSEYKRVLRVLVDGDIGYILEESMIGGRPIAVVMLNEPIVFESWTIRCIEVPCPKAGRSHGEGWEHMEVVVAVSSSSSSSIGQDVDRMVHCHGLDAQTRLREFVASHPDLTFDLKAIHKDINADVSLNLGNNTSVKFHVWPLYKVCQYEQSIGSRIPVTNDYFDSIASEDS